MAKSRLKDEIQQTKPFATPHVEVYLNLRRTHDHLHGGVSRFLKAHGISEPQYNVLRILRGAGEDGLPCLQVSERLVTRVPDITRLLDRLETSRLVERSRSEEDGRVVIARITDKGLKLLADLDEPILTFHSRKLGHMSKAEMQTLIDLLERAREGE